MYFNISNTKFIIWWYFESFDNWRIFVSYILNELLLVKSLHFTFLLSLSLILQRFCIPMFCLFISVDLYIVILRQQFVLFYNNWFFCSGHGGNASFLSLFETLFGHATTKIVLNVLECLPFCFWQVEIYE